MTYKKKTAGKTANGKGARATFLYRHPVTGYIEPVECAYEGDVPPKVWKNLKRQFLKLDEGSYFYPADGMDAYHDAIREVEETAVKIARGEVVLRDASPTTYLTGAAYKTLCNFHQKEVEPMRETYRAVESSTIGKGAVGEDGFDADNYDGTEDNPDPTMTDACGEKCHASVPAGSALTAQRLVEQMIGTPWARERAERAASILEDIYPHLPERVVRAFRAYVAADGKFLEAARIARIPKTELYRKWHTWLAAAKKVGKKCATQITN